MSLEQTPKVMSETEDDSVQTGRIGGTGKMPVPPQDGPPPRNPAFRAGPFPPSHT